MGTLFIRLALACTLALIALSSGLSSPSVQGSAPAVLSSASHTITVPILMYHYVRVVTNPRDMPGIRLSVKPARFAQQMQYLDDKGYTTLTMSDLYDIFEGKMSLPPNPVVLTFDDGYNDFYTTAWPVLRQHHFKATSYIITGFVGRAAYMTWDQIRALDATGMVDFGAHTRNHVDLRSLGSARLWSEVDGSKLDLEQHLGHTVIDFCYPSGEYTARVIAAVERAGFRTATTTHPGDLQDLRWEFTLPRIRVNGTDSLGAWETRLP